MTKRDAEGNDSDQTCSTVLILLEETEEIHANLSKVELSPD
jgi:hypothetical protein